MKKLLILILLFLPLPLRADELKFPPELSFLENLPPLAIAPCVERNTGKEAVCVIIAKEEDKYFTVWDENGLYQVFKFLPDSFELIYQTAKKMRL